MRRPGFCNLYGENTVFICAVLAPVTINAFLLADSGLLFTQIALCGGLFGFIAGAYAHKFANRVVAQENMSMRFGNMFVKNTQAIAYLLPATSALLLNAVMA